MIGFTIPEPGVTAPVHCLFAPSGAIRRTRPAAKAAGHASDALSAMQVPA